MNVSLATQHDPAQPSWDVAFTRLSRQVSERLAAVTGALTHRLEAGGLTCDLQSRQTPRGLSTFLSVVGERGLLFIFDFTLIDGMAVNRHQGATLDVRLLDGCGDVETTCSPQDRPGYCHTLDEIVQTAGVGLDPDLLHVIAIGHFNVVR